MKAIKYLEELIEFEQDYLNGYDVDKQPREHKERLKDLIEAKNEALNMHVVSNRRELLLDFLTKHDKSLTERDITEYVDEYLQI